MGVVIFLPNKCARIPQAAVRELAKLEEVQGQLKKVLQWKRRIIEEQLDSGAAIESGEHKVSIEIVEEGGQMVRRLRVS